MTASSLIAPVVIGVGTVMSLQCELEAFTDTTGASRQTTLASVGCQVGWAESTDATKLRDIGPMPSRRFAPESEAMSFSACPDPALL